MGFPVEELLRPEAYPHRPQRVELRQTHISWVFLAGDLVYKIKKPVNFGFLDFTTLEKREHFCRREVELNRRLCPEIYLGLAPLVRTPEGLRFEEEGEVVEWAVKMRRLPEEGMMGRLITQRRLEEAHLELLVQKLVPFFREAATGPEVNRYGTPEIVRFNVEENFEQTREFVGKALNRLRYEHIVSWSRRFMEENRGLFEERIRQGFVRDGHGDLYSANVCYDDLRAVYVFDCIEFNERFRCGDVAQDLAFMAMDLDFHGLNDLSRFFIDRYVELSSDRGLYEILDFYKCYRAYVRGKIGCFTWADHRVPEMEREKSLMKARRYFDLAYRYAGGKPFLIVIFGLSGTGKSTLARVLSTELLAVHYNSDVVRKELAGLSPTEHRFEPYERGLYAPEMTERTYAELLRRAEAELLAGRDVILDATYRSRKYREGVLKFAKKLDIPVLFVLCETPDTIIKQRLNMRARKEGEPSDGRWEIYLHQKKHFEAPEEIPIGSLIRLETTEPPERLAEKIVIKIAQEKLLNS
ncbi:bifunctional aminoglycoside phosphotransferase/ATP-binding protein [Thermosulfurimonas sp. F29]|uniref:bifunctional aminoglycoside phosphotransferase/ATP-binding protein n=1 Tax=Thermosulfurimonas sp. F29 TaxID=2867247 RepID=UPI001C83D3C5|nr:bifunctional aminoglycoside phosphotransferase/ATP-binding protein [Thermosulfurimonas sp. F29]MBX6423869.1 AAA family ATPase [Thermosulfurimonas sp. F29]